MAPEPEKDLAVSTEQSNAVRKLSKAMESEEDDSSRRQAEIPAFEIDRIKDAPGEEDDITLVPLKKGHSEKKQRKSFQGSIDGTDSFAFDNSTKQILKDSQSDDGTPPLSQNVGLKTQVASAPDIEDQQD